MYKYSPLRRDFFENYLLRATQRVALNDPFEILPSRRWMEHAYRDYYRNEYTGNFPTLLSHISRMNLNSFGVISVASRNDHILMWSHYADCHRGMVVEIDENNKQLKERFDVQDEMELAQDVIYEKDRVDEIDPSNIFSPYVHKALEWSYEEEKRIIVPNLHKCDCWMYVFDSEDEAKSAYKSKVIDGVKVISCERTGKTISFRADDIEKPFNPFDFVNNPRFMSMFRIPPAAIKSVTFGVNSNKKSVGIVRNLIELEPLFKHVKIYEAMLSESSFGITCR